MGKREIFIKLLLVAVLAWGLIGCGGKDETPPAGTSTQTVALVPDSVADSAEAEVLEAAPEAVVAEVESPTNSPAEPAPIPQVKAPEEVHSPVSAPQPVPAPKSEPTQGQGLFSLQLGSYTNASQAAEKAAQLRDLGYPGTVEEAEVHGTIYHRVFIRGLADRPSAEKLGEDLHTRLGLSYLIRRK